MPRIFDNIDQKLLLALQETLTRSERADFCVGYFNLRGWKLVDSYIEKWAGEGGKCCRLLVGMQKLAHDELREDMSILGDKNETDNQTANRMKTRLAEEFRQQLMFGAPNNEDEAGLRRLAAQIRSKKLVIKLFLRHPLHAKLYLLFRPDPMNPNRLDPDNPMVGYLGSSNLTIPGLSKQGELNIDTLDHDACAKLAKWFEDRWNDRLCIDISQELLKIIEESWAREDLVQPYHIYVKMAYHLSQEARAGLSEFKIPRDFGNKLFDFQTAAVKIAAHHLNKRNGVLIGDVVGLGKTLMATALARIFEDDQGIETLIICPKNLVPMWEDYREQYKLRGKVLSISKVLNELPNLRRYRLVLIDESHNLRNREGKKYRAIEEYIRSNDSKCILLSATPYNKSYLDLSNQLRLFVPEDQDIGFRPEKLLKEMGDAEFSSRHQCPVRSLAAFEKSPFADDWRELMRLYLVRRTRSFIQENYATKDADTGRKYLTFEDGTKYYFPSRVPRTMKFEIDERDPRDQYAKLYADPVVDVINNLALPRYGLGNYVAPKPHEPPTSAEAKQIQDLSRAGKRLMGFCRTNLFKRLESSGASFTVSVERHLLRNYIVLHAIENGLPVPIGKQDAEVLDTRYSDTDAEEAASNLFEDDETETVNKLAESMGLKTEVDFKSKAAELYAEYERKHKGKFKWLRSDLFVKTLESDLRKDSKALLKILADCGEWNPSQDAKLEALHTLLTRKHPKEKVLVFSQFADTVNYLEKELSRKGVNSIAGVTGDSPNPTMLAWRFSPESNNKRSQIRPEEELRVLVATDILSEGQNLQDCSIVVNFDLPWAIIRLVQRAGRVDRIGQKAQNILCYSFLPADGVEKIIQLRSRVTRRLKENAEVVGSDEAFFEGEENGQIILSDLFTEKSGLLDGDVDTEVDHDSYAYQIWKNAITADPRLERIIRELPDVIFSSRAHTPTEKLPEGVIVFMRTSEGNDALAYIDRNGKSITESQFEILKAAECNPSTPPQPRHEQHHALVHEGLKQIAREEKQVGGQLGRPSGARYRTYTRLKRYTDEIKGTLLDSKELHKALDEIYQHPLQRESVEALNRQLKSGIDDAHLAELVLNLREVNKLCIVEEDQQTQEPHIICSLGVFAAKKRG
jgi:superfamily II DNA or RNA helicase